jgi:hypothetical protein
MDDKSKSSLSESKSFRCYGMVTLGFVSSAIALSGCARVPALDSQMRSLMGSRSPSSTNLQFQIAPGSTPGTYEVSGRTDFPDQSEIRVAAIRYLKPTQSTPLDFKSKPTYSVLAYQPTKIINGKWQTTLNLWQVAKDGRFQEAWQINQSKLKLPVKPIPEVVFFATLAPGENVDQLQPLEQELQKLGKQLDSSNIGNTADGQRFLRVSSQLKVALPTGSTTPPKMTAADINGGWGNRFLIPPEPPIPYKLEFPKERRTNAPAASSEFLR